MKIESLLAAYLAEEMMLSFLLGSTVAVLSEHPEQLGHARELFARAEKQASPMLSSFELEEIKARPQIAVGHRRVHVSDALLDVLGPPKMPPSPPGELPPEFYPLRVVRLHRPAAEWPTERFAACARFAGEVIDRIVVIQPVVVASGEEGPEMVALVAFASPDSARLAHSDVPFALLHDGTSIGGVSGRRLEVPNGGGAESAHEPLLDEELFSEAA